MTKKYKSAFTTTLLALLLSGFGSCIKEESRVCPDDRVRVRLKLDVETTRGTADNYKIDAVRLYVFDALGGFVTAVDGESYVPGEDYFLYPDIGAGEYRFVVWTNIGEQYKTSHSVEECYTDAPSLSELLLYLDYPSDGCVRTDIPALHYGALGDAVVGEKQDNHFTVVIAPNTNIIRFTVEGLPATEDEYGFTIGDDNSRYNFDNSFGLCTGLQYIRTARFEEGALGASMNTLRLADDRSPAFSFDNATTGETLFSDNLVEMIRRAYSVAGITVDFDAIHEFDIVLKFDTNMRVTVSVNGWNYTTTPGQLE